MSESEKESKTLEERIKNLEVLQRNTRIAIIILVGYSIYDVVSKDSGSEIIFAHKVKAREFELINGQGDIFGSWKVRDDQNKAAGFVIDSIAGNQMTLTADELKFTEDRVNPVSKMILNDKGVSLFDATHSEVNNSE